MTTPSSGPRNALTAVLGPLLLGVLIVGFAASFFLSGDKSSLGYVAPTPAPDAAENPIVTRAWAEGRALITAHAEQAGGRVYGFDAVLNCNVAGHGEVARVGEAGDSRYAVTYPYCCELPGGADGPRKVVRHGRVELLWKGDQFEPAAEPEITQERPATFWRQLYMWLAASLLAPLFFALVTALLAVVLLAVLSGLSGLLMALIVGLLIGVGVGLLFGLPYSGYAGWLCFDSPAAVVVCPLIYLGLTAWPLAIVRAEAIKKARGYDAPGWLAVVVLAGMLGLLVAVVYVIAWYAAGF